MMKINLISFLAFFSIVGLGYAAPVIYDISGDPSHGQIININGAGFGSKSTAQPLVWEDFESYSNGSSIADAGWSVDGTAAVISSSGGRVSANKFAQSALSGLHDIFYKNDLDFSTGKVYVNFWTKFDYGSGDDRYQVKLWRVCSGGSRVDYPSIANYNWVGTDQWFYYELRYPDLNGNLENTTSGMSINYYPDNIWTNVEVEIKLSGINQSDGEFRVWNDGFLDVNKSNLLMRKTNINFSQVRFGEYIGNGGTAATNLFDNIYIDNSWARVMIGDSVSFASAQHREILNPTSWTNTQITAVFNSGSFSSGETAYIYVLDSDGNASQGLPIVIGEGAVEQGAESQFSNGDSGNSDNYSTLTASRWETQDESGNIVYTLNTTDYFQNGDLMGEYSIYQSSSFDNFDLTLKCRSNDNLASNSWADYSVIFGYQDSNNYYFANFSSNASGTMLNKVENGIRTELAWYSGQIMSDNSFHTVRLVKNGNNLIVYYDGSSIMEHSANFSSGKIGVGSYNDSASFDDIVVSEISQTTNYDVNDDGNVNTADVDEVKNQILGINLTTNQADVNSDGNTDSIDLQQVINASGN